MSFPKNKTAMLLWGAILVALLTLTACGSDSSNSTSINTPVDETPSTDDDGSNNGADEEDSSEDAENSDSDNSGSDNSDAEVDTDSEDNTDDTTDNNADIDGAENWFTLAVLPDTQKYSRYSPERYFSQTRWIAENYTEEKQNIKFTLHLGDIVDEVGEQEQWDVARVAMGYLEANPETPYSISAGNHDVWNTGYDNTRDNATEPYLQNFSVERQMANFSTLKGYDDHGGWNTYHIFEVDGQEFLVLAFDWRPTYWNPAWGATNESMALVWANKVLSEHPDLPVIITTHQFLNIADDGETAIFTDNGWRIYNYLIRNNDQVFLVVGGHHHGEAIMEANNSYGHKVVMVVVDYQSGYWGGDGMMQLISFNQQNNSLDFRSYSPYVDALPEESRDPQEQVSRWEFSVDFNFDERFANFNPKEEDGSNATDALGDIEGTRAYWILDADHMLDNQLTEVHDASGNGNVMTLASTGNVEGDQEDFIQVTDEKPPFGFANGSIHFNGDKDGGYYLRTSGTTISTDSSTNGVSGYLPKYTVEAIFRLPEDWTPEIGQWSGILNHVKSITDVCSNHGISCNGGDPALALSISNLKEAQWLSVSQNQKGSDSFSWELNRHQWYHVAITNDGHQALMYVNGSLVMRTGETEQQGLVFMNGNDWRIGISSWNSADADPFYGDIAEVRIVERVLDPDEWLYTQNAAAE